LTSFKPVEAALKDCAGLSVKEFALITRGGNGEEETYTSASLIPHQQKIFTSNFRLDFRRIVQRASPGGSYLYQGRYTSSDTTPLLVQNIPQLAINDEAEVQQYYIARFEDMNQSACKVTKAFVKLVEPKKQTHYPYIKGDIKVPPWWPDTSGENSVQHKEPDHLPKPGGLHCGAIQAAQV
jgi:hypothetical protein